MTIAEKIVKLRKTKGMTQSDLGKELNVTYQAVSKWEHGSSLPDFGTMCKLAKIFGVPIGYFEDGGEQVDESDKPNNADGSNENGTDEQNETVAATEVVGMCVSCGRILHAGEQDGKCDKLTCRACAEKQRLIEEQARANVLRKKAAQQDALNGKFKTRVVWAIIVGAIVAVISLAIHIWLTVTSDESTFIIFLVGCFVTPIVLFLWVFQLFFDGAARTVTCLGLQVIKLPGIIFSASLEGLIFLVIMKIILTVLAWIISFALICATSVIGMIVGIFTFIPLVIKIRKRDESIL